MLTFIKGNDIIKVTSKQRGSRSMIFGYVRVSTKEQNEDRQIEAIKTYCKNEGVDLKERNIIIDKQTGRDFKRPGYQTLKNQLLRKGDTLIIKELDRLGRDMQKIKKEWEDLQEKGIDIIVIDTEILNTKGKSDLEKTLIGNIVLELLSYVAEKENVTRAKRQREGIEIAKKQGKHLGRPSINYNTISNKQRDLIKEYYLQWEKKDITGVKFMEILDLKTNTFYKIMKEYQEILDEGGRE